jgi:uncharacterized membrane protein
MTAPTTHPPATAYLRDLELLLHGVEPGERAEVLAGVREHLEGAVGPGASDDDVRAALAELGPPQAIADEAYAGRTAVGLTAPRPVPRWQALTSCALNVVGFALGAFSILVASGPAGILLRGTAWALPWCATVALSFMAPAWDRRDQWLSALIYPAWVATSAGLVALLTVTIDPSVFSVIPIVALWGFFVWRLVKLARAAAGRYSATGSG